MTRCVDCGTSPRPEQHAVFFVQTQVVAKKRVSFELCGRCWTKRGAEMQQEQRA